MTRKPQASRVLVGSRYCTPFVTLVRRLKPISPIRLAPSHTGLLANVLIQDRLAWNEFPTAYGGLPASVSAPTGSTRNDRCPPTFKGVLRRTDISPATLDSPTVVEKL